MRAYLFVLIYAGMLPLALLSPFAGAMIWAWLSLMYPQSQTYGYFSFGFAAPVAALTLAAFLLSRERALPPSTAVAWSMAGMILACGIAHATAIDREIGAVRWDTIWKGLLLALATLAMLRTQLRIHAFVWIVALSIGYFGLKGGLFTLLTGGRYRVVGADGSIIGDNNHLAVALAMVLPLVAYLAMHAESRLLRAACWVAAPLVAVGALFTYSRGGALALGAMAALAWLRSRHRLAALVPIGLLAVAAFAFAPEALVERLGSIDDYGSDPSAMGRLAIWRVALELALRNPLTGVGFQATALPHVVAQVDPTVTPRAVHNSYLEAFAEAGGLALACHLVMILAAALDLRRTRRATAGVAGWRWAHDLSGMMQASLLAYCVGSFFISFAFYDGWWYLAVLATALRVHACTALAPPGRVVAARAATLGALAARGR